MTPAIRRPHASPIRPLPNNRDISTTSTYEEVASRFNEMKKLDYREPDCQRLRAEYHTMKALVYTMKNTGNDIYNKQYMEVIDDLEALTSKLLPEELSDRQTFVELQSTMVNKRDNKTVIGHLRDAGLNNIFTIDSKAALTRKTNSYDRSVKYAVYRGDKEDFNTYCFQAEMCGVQIIRDWEEPRPTVVEYYELSEKDSKLYSPPTNTQKKRLLELLTTPKPSK